VLWVKEGEVSDGAIEVMNKYAHLRAMAPEPRYMLEGLLDKLFPREICYDTGGTQKA